MIRIGTGGAFDRATAQMAALDARLGAAQARIATGKRLSSAADAPLDAARITALARRQAIDAQAARNADTARLRLSLSDTAMAATGTALGRAQEVLIAAMSASTGPADRAAAAAEITSLSDDILATANARLPDGTYLFGGNRTDRAPYAVTGGASPVWQGDSHIDPVPLGQDGFIRAGEPGDTVFGSGSTSVFATLSGIQSALVDTSGPETRNQRLSALLDQLSGHGETVTTARASIGGRLARLDALAERRTAAAIDIAAERSRLEDTDIAATATLVQRTLLLLQATRDSFARIRATSLFDSLR